MLLSWKPLHNETERHVARMSVRDDDHIQALDLLIRGLINAGLWTKIDTLCVCGPDADDSLLDLKGNVDSILVGTPAFTPYSGYTTTHSPIARIDTQWASMRENNSSLFAYLTAYYIAVISGPAMGQRDSVSGNSSSLLRFHDSGSTTDTICNIQTGGSAAIVSAAYASGLGFSGCSRLNASDVVACLNGAIGSGSASATSWGTPGSVFVGANDGVTATSSNRYNADYASWGNAVGLTQTQMLSLRGLIHAYHTALGAGKP